MSTQFDAGVYGGRICTPASVLVACQYLLGKALSPDMLRSCLRVAHELYVERFKGVRLLMVEDILPLLPPQGYVQTFVAGADDVHHCDVDDGLLLRPLPKLFAELSASERPTAAVLTMQGHTCAYLFGRSGGEVYDPAVGTCVPMLSPASVCEYSGVVLRLQ